MRTIGIAMLLLLSACGGGGGSSSRISAAPANVPPVADAGIDQRVVEGKRVILDGSASRDSDGGIARYAWQQVGGPVVALENASTAVTGFPAPAVAAETVLSFQLTVTDRAGASAADTVWITVEPVAFAVSGTITAGRGIAVDGDVNDPGAPRVPNDTADLAQSIPNPVTVGGYVSVAGAGEPGALQTSGDVSDYYRVEVAEGQRISLQVSDPTRGDPDLYLWDASGTQYLGWSVTAGPTDTVEAPFTGEGLVEVHAFSGASNYTLIIGQVQATAAGSGGFGDDFVPGELIFERRPAPPAKARAADERLTTLGIRPGSAAVGRPVRARLGRAATRARRQALGAVSAGRDYVAAIADDAERHRYETLLAVKTLLRDDAIAYAQPNYRVHAQAVPDDPLYYLQWHYPLIDLPAAWDLTRGDPAVTVAVIDSGVLTGHPDFAGQLVAGYDFISDAARSGDGDGLDPDANDAGDGGDMGPNSYHGTHVAGTVAAASSNRLGVAGVAPRVKVMPLRVLGVGGGTSYDIIQAIRFAAGLPNDSGLLSPPVDVMNLSLGRAGYCSPAEQSAFTAARQAGVVVVAAAGNDAMDAGAAFPASCQGVLAVGAVDLLGNRSYYSNYGPAVDVQAPGGDASVDQNGDGYGDGVLSLLGDETVSPADYFYAFFQGTSMASPHVAGVVALMKSVNPTLTPDDVDALLANGELTDDRGIINAHAAVYAALNALGAPPELNPTLTVQPGSLNFGSAFTYAEIEVRISGGGDLQVSAPTADQPWLSLAPLAVTAANTGRYSVMVERTGLVEGTHTAVITVVSDRNTVEVPVIMQVSGSVHESDAGHLYVLLRESATGTVVDQAEADASGGTYQYRLGAARPGDYEIVAGTDFDNDQFICDAGESCGAYPTLDHPGAITVDADREGIDFSVGRVVPISDLRLEAEPAGVPVGLGSGERVRRPPPVAGARRATAQ